MTISFFLFIMEYFPVRLLPKLHLMIFPTPKLCYVNITEKVVKIYHILLGISQFVILYLRRIYLKTNLFRQTFITFYVG